MGIINNQGVFIGPPLGEGEGTTITSFREDDDFSTDIFDESIVLPSLPNNVGIAFIKSSDSPADYATISLDGTNTSTIFIDNTAGSANLSVSGNITADQVTASGITLTSRKPFDIPHPTKTGHRLRHVCLEGPESGVYYRGRLKDSNIINLPDYWFGLVDPESITIALTQIGYSQDLIVEKIEWGKRIIIKSGTGSNIDCYFIINAERKDGEKLIVEYKGTTIEDYPGDNSIYSINQ